MYNGMYNGIIKEELLKNGKVYNQCQKKVKQLMIQLPIRTIKTYSNYTDTHIIQTNSRTELF